jgi:hypothetical protein
MIRLDHSKESWSMPDYSIAADPTANYPSTAARVEYRRSGLDRMPVFDQGKAEFDAGYAQGQQRAYELAQARTSRRLLPAGETGKSTEEAREAVKRLCANAWGSPNADFIDAYGHMLAAAGTPTDPGLPEPAPAAPVPTKTPQPAPQPAPQPQPDRGEESGRARYHYPEHDEQQMAPSAAPLKRAGFTVNLPDPTSSPRLAVGADAGAAWPRRGSR